MTTVLSGLAACLFYLASLASHLFALHEGRAQQRSLRLAMLLALPALVIGTLIWDWIQRRQPVRVRRRR